LFGFVDQSMNATPFGGVITMKQDNLINVSRSTDLLSMLGNNAALSLEEFSEHGIFHGVTN